MRCLIRRQGRLLSRVGDRRVYFVHSYRATPSPANEDWVLSTSSYGGDFVSSVQKGEVAAAQVRSPSLFGLHAVSCSVPVIA